MARGESNARRSDLGARLLEYKDSKITGESIAMFISNSA
jgi:hypothetical protein